VLIQDILSQIYTLISGERLYYKNSKIEMYSFPRYYWIRENDSTKTYKIKAVHLIEGYENKRDDVMNAQMKLKFYTAAAYINPGDFGGDEKRYQKFIDSAFQKINQSKQKKLIIDLRNNRGGDNSFSDYLVSYIAEKPFRWNAKLTLKTSKFLKEHTRKNNDTTDVYFQNILTHQNGEIYEYRFDPCNPQSKDKRFEGEVFVLVNRQSYSQSAVTAAQIQDYRFGTIVGEETAEYPTLYASRFQYSLPNTGIVVNVSKGQIVRVNGSEKQEGVIPDIVVRDHLLDEDDEIHTHLEYSKK